MSNDVPWRMPHNFRSEGVQKTVDRYKTWERERLEKGIRSLEENRDRAASRNRQEAVQDLAYELEAVRQELRRRE